MDNTLIEYLAHFCIIYINNILVYLKSISEHRPHVRLVLQKLKEEGLWIKSKKCELTVQETVFLRFMISEKRIGMDPEKVHEVLNWETTKNIKNVQYFLGFANFCYQFGNHDS